MRLFSKAKDGGPESPVDGYFLIEIKSRFSIVLLHFNPGTRESFHNHAFNAWTLWLRGRTQEEVKDKGTMKSWQPGQWKYTPRELMHRFITTTTGVYVGLFGGLKRQIKANGAWAISFRGPWVKTWEEYNPTTNETITLTNGRELVTPTN